MLLRHLQAQPGVPAAVLVAVALERDSPLASGFAEQSPKKANFFFVVVEQQDFFAVWLSFQLQPAQETLRRISS